MKIINHYDGNVFWRVFADSDTNNAFGLKDGTLKQGESAEYNDGSFVQLEFKKDALIWFWGETIKKATVFL